MSAVPEAVHEPLLLTQLSDGVLTLTLNRPAQFNPLSVDMMNALQAALDDAQNRSDVRVIVLAALGKAFCAGHDLREIMGTPTTEFHHALFAQCTRLMMRLTQMPQPVIAKVNGVATAAGCQLVSMCDLAVASDASRFAVSGVNLGLFCSTPAVGLSRNVHRKHALEMLLTGDFISAQEAKEKGLVNRVVPADQLDQATHALCQQLLTKPAEALALGKQLFYRQMETGFESAYQMAAHTMACNLTEPATVEGLNAFIEKRAPSWKKG